MLAASDAVGGAATAITALQQLFKKPRVFLQPPYPINRCRSSPKPKADDAHRAPGPRPGEREYRWHESRSPKSQASISGPPSGEGRRPSPAIYALALANRVCARGGINGV
jgi:hypothetical protein